MHGPAIPRILSSDPPPGLFLARAPEAQLTLHARVRGRPGTSGELMEHGFAHCRYERMLLARDLDLFRLKRNEPRQFGAEAGHAMTR